MKIQKKLEYLYGLLEDIKWTEDSYRHQQEYLLEQIDKQKAAMLKTIVEHHLKEIENE